MCCFITREAVSIFRSKFIENLAWKYNHLSICSIKVKSNVTAVSPVKFEKYDILRFSKISLFSSEMHLITLPVSSTSLSGGNQVDGLPHASSSWTPKKC